MAEINVLLIGLGAVGAVYAYHLERSGRVKVTAVARSNYELVAGAGITLDTDRFGVVEHWRPSRVVKSQEEAFASGEVYDFGLITTKYVPDVVRTEATVASALSTGRVKAWSLIQNGLNVESGLSAALAGGAPLISSAAWVSTTGVDGGRRVVYRGVGLLVAGVYPPAAGRAVSADEEGALEMWAEIVRAGEARVEVTDRIDAVRYAKNVWNAVWSSVQGLVRDTPRALVGLPPAAREALRAFTREIVRVGFAAGLLAPGQTRYPAGGLVGDEESVVSGCFDYIMSTAGPDSHRMSLLVDIDNGRPIEVEGILGGVVELARAHAVDTPRLDLVYALLKGVQASLLREQ
ncbi:hypothetical protein Q5752_002780 [Cryptotrichosporon argae]